MKNIFISYSWENGDIVDVLELFLNNAGFKTIRDIRDIQYNQSIKEFMRSITTSDLVLCLISDDFLKSRNCIFEISELINDSSYKNKFIPIIDESASTIFKPYSLEYINFWKNERNKLHESIEKIDNFDIKSQLINEYKMVDTYENSIGKLLSMLRDMNLPLLNENNISEIIIQVIIYIETKIYNEDYYINDNELGVLVNNTKHMISNSSYNQYDINNGFNLDSSKIVIPNKEIIVPQNIVNTIVSVNASIVEQVNKRPSIIHELTPRKFEEFVCELIEKNGYRVTLTQQTRDGGKDLIIAEKRLLGNFLFYVECKKYSPDKPVGVNLVRELYGTISADRATAGILITSSYFSKDAIEFKDKIKHQMSLMNYQELIENVQQLYQ